MYTSSTKSAAEQAAQAAGKSLFLARNVLKDCLVEAHWKNASGFDRDLTGYEADYAADGQVDIPTKPAVASPAEVICDLVFELDASVRGAANVADGIVIAGHNLHTLARAYSTTLTVTAAIAEDSAFAGPDYLQLAQWTVTAGWRNPRLTAYSLAGVFGRYSSIEWFRLRISSPVAFSLSVPEIGEIFLGRTRQLGRGPIRPWYAKGARTEVSVQRTKTGGVSTYELYAGEGVLPVTFEAYDGEDPDTGLDDVGALEALYEDTLAGVEPFVFVPDPENEAARAHVVRYADPRLAGVFSAIDVGEFSLDFLEYPPCVTPEGFTT